MTKNLDSQLKDFFRKEVEQRKEPELRYSVTFTGKPYMAIMSRSLLAAATIAVFWVTALFRPVSPLDTLVDPIQVRQTVGVILEQGSLMMQAYLSDKE